MKVGHVGKQTTLFKITRHFLQITRNFKIHVTNFDK